MILFAPIADWHSPISSGWNLKHKDVPIFIIIKWNVRHVMVGRNS